MGLNLRSLVLKEQIPEDLVIYFNTGRLAIDASSLLYRFLFTYRDSEGFLFMNKRRTHVTSHIFGLFRYLRSCRLDITNFIFIFDGKPPIEKKEELDRRREKKIDTQKKLELAIQMQDVRKTMLYRRLTLELTKDLIDDFKETLRVLGLHYYQAESEADFLISKLYREGAIVGAISEDRDLLLHGIPYLIDPVELEMISLESLLESASWTQEQLVTYGILLGTDYPGKAKGFGEITGKRLISKTDPQDPFGTLVPSKSMVLPSQELFDTTYSLYTEAYQDYSYLDSFTGERDLMRVIELLDFYDISSEEVISFIRQL